eukprot:4587501-Lingulodinium_polyedra.AAC.1
MIGSVSVAPSGAQRRTPYSARALFLSQTNTLHATPCSALNPKKKSSPGLFSTAVVSGSCEGTATTAGCAPAAGSTTA